MQRPHPAKGVGCARKRGVVRPAQRFAHRRRRANQRGMPTEGACSGANALGVNMLVRAGAASSGTAAHTSPPAQSYT